jgi:hypothetical protein
MLSSIGGIQQRPAAFAAFPVFPVKQHQAGPSSTDERRAASMTVKFGSSDINVPNEPRAPPAACPEFPCQAALSDVEQRFQSSHVEQQVVLTASSSVERL